MGIGLPAGFDQLRVDQAAGGGFVQMHVAGGLGGAVCKALLFIGAGLALCRLQLGVELGLELHGALLGLFGQGLVDGGFFLGAGGQGAFLRSLRFQQAGQLCLVSAAGLHVL